MFFYKLQENNLIGIVTFRPALSTRFDVIIDPKNWMAATKAPAVFGGIVEPASSKMFAV